MASRTAIDPDEAPPLTAAELAEMRPAHEVHTPEEFAALTAVRKRGRPPSDHKKVPVTIRLDAETVAAFKAMGDGWQTMMNDVLSRSASTWAKRDPATGAFLHTKQDVSAKVRRAGRAKTAA